VDHGRVAVRRVAPAEPRLGWVELRPRLALKPLEQEPLKHLTEDTDNRDRAEVVGVPSLVRVLGEQVDLGLVPRLRGPSLLKALVIEVTEPGDQPRLLDGLEELDVDAVRAAALVRLLPLDLVHDLLPSPGGEVPQTAGGQP
jgi:hypothetical protein